MASITTHSMLDRILDPVSRCFTPEAAKRLIDLRADASVQNRVDELADKCTEGTLTASEREEYELYITANTMIAILQAKVKAILGTQTAA